MRVVEMIKEKDWTTIKFRTTYGMGWKDCICFVQSLYEYIGDAEVLIGNREKQVVCDIKNAKDVENMQENMVLIIRGKNKVYDNVPFIFTFFNQTDNGFMQIPTAYLESLRKSETEFLNQEEQFHTFDKFLDSIELLYTRNSTEKKVVNEIRSAFLQYNQFKQDGNLVYKVGFTNLDLTEIVNKIKENN